MDWDGESFFWLHAPKKIKTTLGGKKEKPRGGWTRTALHGWLVGVEHKWIVTLKRKRCYGAWMKCRKNWNAWSENERSPRPNGEAERKAGETFGRE